MSERSRFFAVIQRLNDQLRDGFGQSVKIRLIQRHESVTALARRIGFPRNSVSLAIHGRRRMPRIETAIRQDLGIKETA